MSGASTRAAVTGAITNGSNDGFYDSTHSESPARRRAFFMSIWSGRIAASRRAFVGARG
jgi:hypothetical protein